MSNNAKRHLSKRQFKKEVKQAVTDLNCRVDKYRGRFIITPKALLKGYVKWNAAVMRAIRPLAQEWGISVRSEEPGRLVFS